MLGDEILLTLVARLNKEADEAEKQNTPASEEVAAHVTLLRQAVQRLCAFVDQAAQPEPTAGPMVSARDGTNPIQVAEQMQRMVAGGSTMGDVAASFKMSQGSVSRFLALLWLPPIVRLLIQDGELKALQGYELSLLSKTTSLTSYELTYLARNAIEHGWSVQALRSFATRKAEAKKGGRS